MKTTMRKHLTCIRMATIKKTWKTASISEEVKKKWNPCAVWWECKIVHKL